MYDNDAITLTHELVGASSFLFIPAQPTYYYVVGYSIQQSGQASDTQLKCGTTVVFRNYAKDNPYQQVSLKCKDDFTGVKTGNDSSFITVTYIPRDLSQLPPSQTQISTTSGNLVEAGMLSREAMQGFAYIVFIGLALLVLMEGIKLGLWFFNKRV